MLGYTDPDLGGPGPLLEGRLPEAAGEVVANAGNEEDGFGIGSTVTVQPAGIDLEVVGLADDVGINVLPTVFTTSDTYLAVPDGDPPATLDVPNVLGVSPASGTTVAELTTAPTVPTSQSTRCDASTPLSSTPASSRSSSRSR